MNSITLSPLSGDAIDALPEEAPVGSIVPMTAFMGRNQVAKDGRPGFFLRPGFAGREVHPDWLLRLIGGKAVERSLDMEVSLDSAGIKRDRIFFEVFKGDVNFTLTPEDEAEVEGDLRARTSDIKTLDGYWVATWDIQTKADGIKIDEALFQRVL